MSQSLGSLVIVLHGHLPYVLHHGRYPHGEAWLYEAAAETYMPLLDIIGEAALLQALEQGWIRGAALDVFDQEPLPAGHPYYASRKILLSPHCADHTPGWQDLAMRNFLENFRRFQRGQPLHNIVDKRSGY